MGTLPGPGMSTLQLTADVQAKAHTSIAVEVEGILRTRRGHNVAAGSGVQGHTPGAWREAAPTKGSGGAGCHGFAGCSSAGNGVQTDCGA